MQCSTCGNTLAPDARFCPHCGAHIVTQPQPAPVYAGLPMVFPYTRVARHLQIVGILWIVYAFTRTAGKLIGLIFLHGLFGSHIHNNWGYGWSPFANMGFAMLWPIVAVSIVIGVALSLLTGYALLTRQPWGRIFAIVVAILTLFHPLTGTALGIYTLWVLAPGASGAEYAVLAASAHRV